MKNLMRKIKEQIREHRVLTAFASAALIFWTGSAIDSKCPIDTSINQVYKVVRIWNPKTKEAKQCGARQGIVEYVSKNNQTNLILMGDENNSWFRSGKPQNSLKTIYENRPDTVLTHDFTRHYRVIGLGAHEEQYTLHLPREGNVK